MKWEIKNQAEQNTADIYINDFIGDWIDGYWGFGVTSKAFLDELQRLADSVQTLRVHINSPGGDVMAATHIANMLRDQQTKGRHVEVIVEGAAWSAATIITSAGNPTSIADNALMMVHDPWTFVLGNSREMRKAAETSDKFRDSIVASYKWKSQLSEADLIEMMAAETWMDAEEAIANGFADAKIDSVPIAALFDAARLEKIQDIPAKYQDRVKALLKSPEALAPAPAPEGAAAGPADTSPAPAAAPAPDLPAPTLDSKAVLAEAREIVSLCAKAGVPEAATDFLDKNLTADQVRDLLKDAPAIRDACAAARVPNRANDYIKAGMSVKEVRSVLFDVMKALAGPEIDSRQGPDAGRKDKPLFDPAAIMARYVKKRF